MATAKKINEYDIKDVISGYNTNAGVFDAISTSPGLTGTITTTGTIKCDLKSETKSSLTAATRGSTSSREYPIGVDANRDLSVNVPWTNTTYSASNNISISSNQISVTNFGYINYSSANNPSVPNNTNTTLTSASGFLGYRWLIIATVTWQLSAAGIRRLQFSTSNGGNAIDNYCTTTLSPMPSGTNYTPQHQLISFINFTNANTLYLVGYQNSGGSLTATNVNMRWVRINKN